MKIYFETSAVNTFAKDHTIADAIATKSFQNLKGRSWCISPVTLWEIMLTTDKEKRESLIYFCQHLFDAVLLPTPEEIIVEFINNGCPLVEQPRNLISNSNIANIWREISEIKEKTLIYDQDELSKRIKLFIPFSKMLRKIIKNEDVIISPKNKIAGVDVTLNNLIEQLSFVKEGEYVSAENRRLYKLSIFYLMLILCAEVGLNNEAIQNFWVNFGVDRTLDRILFAIKRWERLIHRGPFIEMAIMTRVQNETKFSRGEYFDGLHSIYLPFVDLFITDDQHFLNMREYLKGHPNSRKIVGINELKFTYHERIK
jgi:hypothetical protein